MTTEAAPNTNQAPVEAVAPADAGAKPVATEAAAPAEVKPAENAAPASAQAAPQDEIADKAPDGEKPKDEQAAKKAPEKYELKAPEGFKVDVTLTQKIEEFARANDLPQEQAQAILNLGPEVSKMFNDQLIANVNAASDKWAEQSRADKELSNGGDPKILAENLALAAKARDTFATPELTALLDRFDAKKNPNGTGLGNHPEVIRLFTRLGKAISEDNKLITGSNPSGEKSAAQKLYAK